ncbi:MAG: helix-turn-helix domain-containing protein [Candidatus Ornithomonoglobus sp.]
MHEETLQNIKTIIERKGYKKKIIAAKMGYKENQFSDLLNGRRVVKLDDIIQLCDLLEVQPNDLIRRPLNKTA